MKDLQYEVGNSTYRYENETIEGTGRRVAKALAAVEKEENREYGEEQFYNNLKDFKCTLGGRILSNAGTDYKGTSLLNCFVLGRSLNRKGEAIDSINGIYTDLLEQAITLKSEGGWGCNFGGCRPRGTIVKGIGAETPGAVAFMELFDKSSALITQGSGLKKKHNKTKNKIRKGAMMGILPITHPDVVEFIYAKQTQNRLTKFNISVAITDDFMYAVENDLDGELIFPDTEFEKYDKEGDGNINLGKEKGYPVIVYETKKAKDLGNIIMKATHSRNEPGVIFIDTMNKMNNLGYCETIEATNPCSEICMDSGSVCLLGSLNLVHFLNENKTDGDYKKLSDHIIIQVRMMDNVNEITYVPLDVQKEQLLNKRRLGIGILGYASALAIMKIPYSSNKGLELTENLMNFIINEAYRASSILSKEKGAFPLFDCDKFLQSKFIQKNISKEIQNLIKKYGIRNSHLLAIAPTGNTAIYAGIVSGGLEPIFMKEYVRGVIQNSRPDNMVSSKYGEGMYEETEHFKGGKFGDEDVLVGQDEWSDYIIDKNRGLVKKNIVRDYAYEYMLENIDKYPECQNDDCEYLRTTTSLTVEEHINTMKIFSNKLDLAASKTINLPNDYSFDDFKDLYYNAGKAGIKGITTYRAGTMTAVLTAKEEKEKDTLNGEEIIQDSIKLPDNYVAKGTILRAEGKKGYIHTNFFPESDRPFAIFVSTNNHEPNIVANNALELLEELARQKGIPDKGIDETIAKCKGQAGAIRIARMLSLCLRHGILIRNIVSTLDKVEEAYVSTFVFAIKKYLSSFIKDGEEASGVCQECGSKNMVYQEGCKKCNDCGNSLCG